MSDCVFVENKAKCPDDGEGTPPPAPSCAPFSICVGNKTLSYDGACLTTTPSLTPIADGTYSQITFSGGCIVGVGQIPVPSYTPSSCCAPAGSTGESGQSTAVSGQPCNLLQNTSAGLLVSPTIRGEGAVTVSGCGTSSDPWVIKSSGGGGSGVGISLASGDTPIRVQGSGAATDPALIGMNASGVEPGTYQGFTVNRFGLVTGYAAVGGVRSIESSPDVTATDMSNGAYAMSLTNTLPAGGTVTLGRFKVTVSMKGRVTNLTEAAETFPAGKFYTPAHPTDTSITAKVITFDNNGVITDVQEYVPPLAP